MSTEYMEKALTEVRQQIATLQDVEESLSAALGRGTMSHTAARRAPRIGAVVAGGAPRQKRVMSEDAKQRIRDAQKARWANKSIADAAAPIVGTPIHPAPVKTENQPIAVVPSLSKEEVDKLNKATSPAKTEPPKPTEAPKKDGAKKTH